MNLPGRTIRSVLESIFFHNAPPEAGLISDLTLTSGIPPEVIAAAVCPSALCAQITSGENLRTSFPNEGMADVKSSVKWAENLAEKYGSEVVFMPIEMEPGSPWHLRPERYGIVSRRGTFEDFVENAGTRGYRPSSADPGYEFPDFEKIMALLKSRGLAV